MSKLDIIFACSDAGIHIDGAKDGCKKLYDEIKYDNKYLLMQKDFNKSLDVNDKCKNLKEVNSFNKKLYNESLKVFNQNHKLLTIGGDHSIVIASSLAANKCNKSGIIWIDSHGDYNSFKTTITGNLHGLPLAVINGFEKDKLLPFDNDSFINPKNTVIIGGRDFDKEEKVNLKNNGIKIFSVEDIRREGIEKIVKKSFDIASNNTLGVHVSYDIDVIDPKDAPGVSVPAKKGINKEEALLLMDEVLKYSNKINSMDIVEYNSKRDKNNITFDITCNLIEKVMSKLID